MSTKNEYPTLEMAERVLPTSRPKKIDCTAVIYPAPWPVGTMPPVPDALPCKASLHGTDGIPARAGLEVAAALLAQLEREGEVAVPDCFTVRTVELAFSPDDMAATREDYITIEFRRGGRGRRMRFSATRTVRGERRLATPEELEEERRNLSEVLAFCSRLESRVDRGKQGAKQVASRVRTVANAAPPHDSQHCPPCTTGWPSLPASSVAKFCTECGLRIQSANAKFCGECGTRRECGR